MTANGDRKFTGSNLGCTLRCGFSCQSFSQSASDGTVTSASLERSVTGLAGRSFVNQNRPMVVSSPGGRGSKVRASVKTNFPKACSILNRCANLPSGLRPPQFRLGWPIRPRCAWCTDTGTAAPRQETPFQERFNFRAKPEQRRLDANPSRHFL